jgi:hypothetical protein
MMEVEGGIEGDSLFVIITFTCRLLVTYKTDTREPVVSSCLMVRWKRRKRLRKRRRLEEGGSLVE